MVSNLLLIGDWLALGFFVFLGQLDHEMIGANPPRLLRTTWPRLAAVDDRCSTVSAYKLPPDMTARTFLAVR